MKKCISTLPNPIGILMLMCLVLVSCSSISSMGNKHNNAMSSTCKINAERKQQKDSVLVLVKDSTFTSERQRGDTVYRERIVYRDRTAYRDRWHERIVQDTVVLRDSIVQIVEKPPQAYVPKFYKWSTAVLWIILAAGIVYIALRWKIRCL